jgi:N-carbamoyl-L-amino-acid hydrolase
MNARSDALLAAAGFALAVRDTVTRDFPHCVGTVGSIEVERPSFDVVPGRVHLMLELRAPATELLDTLETAVLAAAHREATATGVEIKTVGRWEPVELDARLQQVMTDAAHDLSLSTRRLASGAGHDAQALAAITAASMIFVPSVAGISHDPAERKPWRGCLNGANVLLRTALAIVQSRHY